MEEYSFPRNSGRKTLSLESNTVCRLYLTPQKIDLIKRRQVKPALEGGRLIRCNREDEV